MRAKLKLCISIVLILLLFIIPIFCFDLLKSLVLDYSTIKLQDFGRMGMPLVVALIFDICLLLLLILVFVNWGTNILKSFRSLNFIFKLVIVMGVVLFLLFLSSAILERYEISKDNGSTWIGTPIKIFLELQYNSFVAFGNLIVSPDLDFSKVDVPIYKVYIKQDNLDKLNENMPLSGLNQTVSGFFIDNDGIKYDLKLRYRGDSYYHWGGVKKSWRVRIKNHTLFGEVNKFNIVVPKYMAHYEPIITTYLSQKLNLITPEVYNVVLFVNSKYSGVYYYLDQLDDLFLIKNDLLPGDIFSGDRWGGNSTTWMTAEMSTRMLFDDPTHWDIVTTYDGDENRSKQVFNTFFYNITRANKLDFYSFFNKHIGEGYLRFLAQKTLLWNDHTDDKHNHKFYFDPSSAVFVPIPWDQAFNTVPENDLTIDLVNNAIDTKVLTYPEFVNEKNKFLFDLINKVPEEELIKLTNNPSIEYLLSKDVHKTVGTWPLSRYFFNFEQKKAIEDLRNLIKERYKLIREKLSEADVTLYNIQNKGLVVDVGGVSGVALDSIKFDAGIGCIGLSYDGISTKKNVCENKALELKFYPGRYLDGEAVSDVQLRYYLLTKDKINLNNIKFSNDVTGEDVDYKLVNLNDFEELPVLKETISVHPWLFLEDKVKTITLGNGNVEINEDLIIDKDQTLLIEPGTNILFSENVSIISYGKIIAKGTKDLQIKFLPNDANTIWGAVALQGKNAEGIFENCLFERGSGEVYDMVHYTGMISAYNSNVSFKNCIIRNNKREDDTINVKKGNLEFINSTMEDVLSDGIDLDISTGKVVNSFFKNTGGDAIDLMTSTTLIENNIIIGAGDKGISIGEGSNPLIVNNKIINSTIGIQSKDNSMPVVKNNIFINNGMAISAYMKKWEYGAGGKGIFINNDLCNNKKIVDVQDVYSNLTFVFDYGNVTCELNNCPGICK